MTSISINRLFDIVATTSTATTILLILMLFAPTLVVADGNHNSHDNHNTTLFPPPVVVDLSQDFEQHIDDGSPGAIQVATTAASNPKIQSTIVLEHGKVVASYYRDNDANVRPVWSTTKSWMSLLIGLLIQDELLTLDTTLGDVFAKDHDESSSFGGDDVWTNLTRNDSNRASFLHDVTIRQLLTMTSGLLDPAPWDINIDLDHGGTAGGASLVGALHYPLIGNDANEDDEDNYISDGKGGDFSYLGVSNILSYVIKEQTGLSPKQYAISKHVFTSLGMMNDEDLDDDVITWWQNEDGIEYSYHGMALTAMQMAKFGQLYLQQGLVTPNDARLVSSEWIVNSTTFQVEAVLYNPFANETIVADYGYLFWLWNGSQLPGFRNNNVGDFYCAIGYGGQDICVSPRLDRVSVQQRDYEDGMGNLIMAAVAFDETLSFGTSEQ